MTDLTGKQIAETYKQLLRVGVSTNSGVSTTLQNIQSGDGTNSAMQLSTTAIKSTSKIITVSICATNDVHVEGNVCATAFFGDGAGLTNVSLSVSSSVAHFTANTLDVPTCASITNLVVATGSFTTKVSGVAGEFSGIVSALTFDGALTGDVTGDIDGATGSFSACISSTNLVAATGSFTTKVSGVAAEFSGIVSALTFDGALTGDVTGDVTGNLTGDVDGATGSFSACISATNLVAATGSFTTKVSGVAGEFSGNVCAVEYYGDGSNLTGISHPTSVAAMTINTLGVVTAASITSLVAPYGSFTTKVSGVAAEFSGIVSALTFDGALTGDVTGDLSGDVTGDIDGATGSFSACISSTNLVAATGSFTTKVSGVAAEFSGNVCASEFYGGGANITGITHPTSVAAMTINTLGVVTAASITSLVAPYGSFTTKVSGVAAEFSGIVSALTFDGALTGDVTGDLSGNVTGDIDGATGSFSACISSTNLVAATGSFTTKVSGVAGEFSGIVSALTFDGALTGDVTGDLSGNVTGDIDGATGSFSACISSTNLVAATGSFTTKVSGVAGEFSGNVCATEFYGGGANITGISFGTSTASFTVNSLTIVTATYLPDGAVGTPGLTNTGDTDTGIFFSDADKLNIAAGGAEAVEFGAVDSETVFNDGGVNIDLRVESTSITDILKVDAGDDTTRIKGFIYEQQVISASISSGTHTIDLSKANIYDLTFLNDCSLAFSNVAPSGRAQDFTLIIRRTAAASVSFDPIILTAGGVTLGLADTDGRTDVLTMFTVDGGSQFYTASSFLAAATVAA